MLAAGDESKGLKPGRACCHDGAVEAGVTGDKTYGLHLGHCPLSLCVSPICLLPLLFLSPCHVSTGVFLLPNSQPWLEHLGRLFLYCHFCLCLCLHVSPRSPACEVDNHLLVSGVVWCAVASLLFASISDGVSYTAESCS